MALFPVVYLSLIGLAIFMGGVYVCSPVLERAITWLEKAGRDNEPDVEGPSA